MNVLLLLDMVASANPDAVAVQIGTQQMTAGEMLSAAWAAAKDFSGRDAVAYVGTNDLAFPIALFGAAAAEVPFVPLNYRLPESQRADLLARHGDVAVVEPGTLGPGDGSGDVPMDGDAIALLLYTSGTTAAPKAAVLRHRHLTSYVIGSVEFLGADPDTCALVSVPPYHIAGVANLLSNLYLGRRLVYLPQFSADEWLATVRAEGVTHAMVVPTMLARLCEACDGPVPSLRALSYGGSRTPATVLEKVLTVFPGVDLTNAYGLTETSSTIAVLDPDDHRAAFASDDPAVRARLASAGRVLPTVEVSIRDGEIWVRGEQVSGEYLGLAPSADADGWFPTRDRGWLDEDGYLFIEGRSDDTIIRGGENIAPAEIEEVLLRHPAIAECAVVGVPDEEWGQSIAAVVVLRDAAVVDSEEIRAFVRDQLRGSKTPDTVTVVDELPYTETGKLLRRVVLANLASGG